MLLLFLQILFWSSFPEYYISIFPSPDMLIFELKHNGSDMLNYLSVNETPLVNGAWTRAGVPNTSIAKVLWVERMALKRN